MPTSLDLLQTLTEVPLLSSKQFSELQQAVRGRHLPIDKVIDFLRKRDWITDFQADKLLSGRAGELLLGQSYLLLTKLGEGGMGQVYKARHLLMDTLRAIKVIRPDHLANERSVQRFYREVKAAARLKHPNVIQALDVAEADGVHYFVMEYVEGLDLAKLVAGAGPLPVPKAADYVRQAALGLQHAHEQGLVHRDVKPSNLLLTRVGTSVKVDVVKVLDLGLARLHEMDDETPLTPAGASMGTPDFMAPEQFKDVTAVDIRADVYSLGCTLYQLLTASVPFPQGNYGSKLYRHLNEAPEPVTQFRSDVPADLLAVLDCMMAKRPEDRQQVPLQVAHELAPFCRGSAEPLSSVGQPRSSGTLPVMSGEQLSSAETGTQSTSATSPLRRQQHQGSRRPIGIGLVFGLLLMLPILGVIWWLSTGTGEAPTREQVAKGDDSSASSRRTSSGGPSTKPDSVQPRAVQPLVNPQRQEPKPGEVITGALGMKFAYVPAGKFWMGGGDGKRGDREVPIEKPFYAGVFEVTQGEWEEIMGSNPSYFSRTGGGKDKVKIKDLLDEKLSRFPVESVSWNDVQTFLKKLNEREKGNKLVYRLPTEEEWEYICRGGSTSSQLYGVNDPYTYHFYFNKPTNSLSFSSANFDGKFPYPNTARKGPSLRRICGVGLYQSNCLGIYDLHGNVWEWTSSLYEGGPDRVIRGGCWNRSGALCRASYRRRDGLGDSFDGLGFRLLAVPSQQE